MLLYYKTKKFRHLQSVWYRKLEKADFDDIEAGNHHGTQLQDLKERIHFQPGLKDLTQAYFDWALHQVIHGKFKSARHKKIWAAHAEGLSASEIGKTFGLSRWRISDILSGISTKLKDQSRKRK